MIRRILTTLLVVFSWSVVDAGTFAELEPGVSRKADADRVLGPPIREVVAGTRYDYNPAAYDARRISIEFATQTGVIASIDLYLAQQYSKSDYQSWFELGQPTSRSYDDSGNLVETYRVAGIALHFDGAGETDPVRFFRHIDLPSTAGTLTRQTGGSSTNSTPGPGRAATGGVGGGQRSADQYVAMAEKAESEEDWPTLISVVEEGLRVYPDQACLWNLRGSFFYHDGGGTPLEIRSKEVMRSTLRAYQLVPDYDHTFDLAWSYYKVLDDCSSANYYLEQIEEEATAKHPRLIYVMGTCYERTGNIEAAIRYYRRYLTREPETPQAEKVRDRLYVLDR